MRGLPGIQPATHWGQDSASSLTSWPQLRQGWSAISVPSRDSYLSPSRVTGVVVAPDAELEDDSSLLVYFGLDPHDL